MNRKLKERMLFNWTVMKTRLSARTSESPTWFIQLRREDLLLEPDGLDGETIECTHSTIGDKHVPCQLIMARLRVGQNHITAVRIIGISGKGIYAFRNYQNTFDFISMIFALMFDLDVPPTIA